MSMRIQDVLAEAVATHGTRPAHRVKRGGAWQTITWSEYGRNVRRAARAFINLGIEPGNGVSLIGQSSPEWFVAYVGAILAGATPIALATVSTGDQVRDITDRCGAKVSFADTALQVAKFLAEEERLPKVEVVVQMVGTPATEVSGHIRVLAWHEFLSVGDDLPEAELEVRLTSQKPDDVCLLTYTAPETGEPKPVTITHSNIVWTAGSLLISLNVGQEDITLTYLPLRHVAEQVLAIHLPMWMGSVVYFAESLEKLSENVAEVQPTVFMGTGTLDWTVMGDIEKSLSADL